MANIRMLQARREAVEKEKLKEQGTLKAQRSQEIDTLDVAKKTNIEDVARTAKKAKRDAFLAQSEIQLADKKIANASLGAAVGAFAAIASVVGSAASLLSPKKSEGEQAQDEAKNARDSAKSARGQADTARGSATTAKTEADKPGATQAQKENAVKLDKEATKLENKAKGLETRAELLEKKASTLLIKEGKPDPYAKPAGADNPTTVPGQTAQASPAPTAVPGQTAQASPATTTANEQPAQASPATTTANEQPAQASPATATAVPGQTAQSDPNTGNKAVKSAILVDGKTTVDFNLKENKKNVSAAFQFTKETLADSKYDYDNKLDTNKPGSATFARKQERDQQKVDYKNSKKDKSDTLSSALSKSFVDKPAVVGNPPASNGTSSPTTTNSSGDATVNPNTATTANTTGTDYAKKYFDQDKEGNVTLKVGENGKSLLQNDIENGENGLNDPSKVATLINTLANTPGGAKAAGKLIAGLEESDPHLLGEILKATSTNPDGTKSEPIISRDAIEAIIGNSNQNTLDALSRGLDFSAKSKDNVDGRTDVDGPDGLKNKIGGSKATPEKASGFNATLLIFNIGIPALQFFLQQLDKIREAQDGKNEAMKKLAGANKLLAVLGQELKRQGAVNTDSHATKQ